MIARTEVAREERDASDPRATKRTRTTSLTNRDTPAKRSRVSRACDQCRASREKCDGGKPQCQTCESQKRACTYNEPPKKRGIQPNYIRTLELTLAWIFRASPDAQSSLSQVLPEANGPAQKLIGGKDAAGAETLHQIWRNSLVCKQVDQLLSGVTVEAGIHAIDPRLSGAPMNGEPSQSTRIPTAPISTQVNAPQDQDIASSPCRSDQRGANASSLQHSSVSTHSIPEKLRLPQTSWTLLEYYFAFTQSWLPMTEKHHVLRTMYAYPAEGLAHRQAAATGDHAELWSILALAAFQLSRKTIEDQSFTTYRANAWSLIPSAHDVGESTISEKAFQKGHIRALLVLSLLSISTQSWQTAWTEIGLAVRLILQMYAHADRNTGDRSDRPILHLAAYIIENTIARHLSLVPHMRAESIVGFDSLDEDGLEEWAPWTDPTSPISGVAKAPSKAFSTFNALVHELRIAEDDFSTPGKSDHQPETVLALLSNACKREHREQPSKLAAGIQSPELSAPPRSAAVTTERPATAGPAHLTSRNQYSDPTAQFYQPGPARSNYLSIPNDIGAFDAQSQATAGSATIEGSTWSNYNSNVPNATGADIFEELAMLDSVEPMGQHPQFMQNLGFGPDLDLAEFFGSDYQPSNPLLAYMQPQDNSINGPGPGFG